jgi:hypothetical protein
MTKEGVSCATHPKWGPMSVRPMSPREKRCKTEDRSPCALKPTTPIDLPLHLKLLSVDVPSAGSLPPSLHENSVVFSDLSERQAI